MIDIKFLREHPDIVKQNIKNKFQDEKLPLVDEVIDFDKKYRDIILTDDKLRSERNSNSKQIGILMGQGKKDEAEILKEKVSEINSKLDENEELEKNYSAEIKSRMMRIPNIMDPSVPIGKDDSENVEVQRFGEPKVPDYEIPYGFTYCIPPFMIHGDIVNGVMSFEEMDAMMYKIEGEDLYLIGTSEHSMIGRFKGQIVKEDELPIKMTSYSPCFRKEIGSHGLEERGLYRVHQFEKQEMIVLCKPEDSKAMYDKMWKLSVDLFRSWNVPVRQLDCCSGDLADLKVKSCDIEAWSPRQKKYFEVCSCSNLGDAQARRLGIRAKGKDGNYLVHTLNNTVVATPRGLIAVLENNYNEDGSVTIPEVLRPYMGNMDKIVPQK